MGQSLAFRHILYDIWVEDPAILERTEPLEAVMLEAARRSNAVILHCHFHQFAPHGVTGVVLIAESHLSIHTWSEDNFAAIDVFSCGGGMEPDKAVEYLRERLQPVRERITDLARGGVIEPEA